MESVCEVDKSSTEANTMQIEETASSLSNMCIKNKDEVKIDMKSDMLDFVSRSSAFFKSQQKGDPDLSTYEKRSIASSILDKSPGRFLAQFGRYLREDHLKYFEPLRSDYEVNFYVEQALERLCKFTSHIKVKNRRYEALRRLVKEGSYFSETEMRSRNPLLYSQLVGQYLTEEEQEEIDKIDKGNCSLVNIMLEHLDRNEECSLRRRQQEAEDCAEEEEEESEDEGVDEDMDGDINDSGDVKTPNISLEEKVLLRQEFESSMHRSFLEGRDIDFNYSDVDFNNEYDALDQVQRDEEEKFFDSEEPELIEGESEMNIDEPSDELDQFMQRLEKSSTLS